MLKVSVPATSANLGPGFDSVGTALNLYNDFYFYEKGKGKLPPGGSLLNKDSLCHQAMQLFAKRSGLQIPSLEIAIVANVPRSRGLGSSATLTVAGLIAAGVILDVSLAEETIIELASMIEGHPDNAAPALLGGLVVSISTPEGIKYIKTMPAGGLNVVVAVPAFELATSTARKVLPRELPHQDAVKNTGRFGFFMASIFTGDYTNLKYSMEDLLHQPYRMPLVPGLKDVMEAAIASDSLGSCLSGAGPTILAFCKDNPTQVGQAMGQKWQEFNIKSEIYLLHIPEQGASWEVIQDRIK